MATYIFYISRRYGKNMQPIHLVGGKTVFIRAELAKSDDVTEALDRARPRKGESVMNTHRLEDLEVVMK